MTQSVLAREVEIAQLRDRLRAGRRVAVVGEAGIGKTTLLRAASANHPAPVFAGNALATLRWYPYLPVSQALRRPVPEGDAARGRGVGGPNRPHRPPAARRPALGRLGHPVPAAVVARSRRAVPGDAGRRPWRCGVAPGRPSCRLRTDGGRGSRCRRVRRAGPAAPARPACRGAGADRDQRRRQPVPAGGAGIVGVELAEPARGRRRPARCVHAARAGGACRSGPARPAGEPGVCGPGAGGTYRGKPGHPRRRAGLGTARVARRRGGRASDVRHPTPAARPAGRRPLEPGGARSPSRRRGPHGRGAPRRACRGCRDRASGPAGRPPHPRRGLLCGSRGPPASSRCGRRAAVGRGRGGRAEMRRRRGVGG